MGLDKKTKKKKVTKKKNRWALKIDDNPKRVRCPFGSKLAFFNSSKSQQLIEDHLGVNISRTLRTTLKNFSYVKESKIVGFEEVKDKKTGEMVKRAVKITTYKYKPSKELVKHVPIAKFPKNRNLYQERTTDVAALYIIEKIRKTTENLKLMKKKYPKSRRLVSTKDIDIAFNPKFEISKYTYKLENNNDFKSKKNPIPTRKGGGVGSECSGWVTVTLNGFTYCLPNLQQQQQKKTVKKKKSQRKKTSKNRKKKKV